ncbi:MAG TPA: DNA polymerase III subunit chi [Burkholderiaceae bacterium]|nr:DNA polymerase III subunit chi [Burkholderiaceae bacterium]
MTRVDFHSKVADKIGYACRLVRKARAADCRVVIVTDGAAQLQVLDEALWTFSELDFLPHAKAEDAIAAQTPIILATNADNALPHHQILINLSSETPVHFTQFERMLEIVSAEPADAAAGRERYRYYQQQGYPLTHFVADKVANKI